MSARGQRPSSSAVWLYVGLSGCLSHVFTEAQIGMARHPAPQDWVGRRIPRSQAPHSRWPVEGRRRRSGSRIYEQSLWQRGREGQMGGRQRQTRRGGALGRGQGAPGDRRIRKLDWLQGWPVQDGGAAYWSKLRTGICKGEQTSGALCQHLSPPRKSGATLGRAQTISCTTHPTPHALSVSRWIARDCRSEGGALARAAVAGCHCHPTPQCHRPAAPVPE